MGVHCEIKVYKTVGDVIRPGSLVSGVLKYVIDKDVVCNKITVSFKGNGRLLVKSKRRRSNLHSYRKTEDYVNIDYIIYKDEAGAKLPTGTYETEFNFILPENIPPSVNFTNKSARYFTRCYINYYIRVKFEKTGVVSNVIKFRKAVKVISIPIPKLSTEPTVYAEEMTFGRALSRRISVLKVVATIDNSVVVSGHKIRIEYEVTNNANVNVTSVMTKLIEVYTIKGKGGRKITFVEHLTNTKKISGGINVGEMKTRRVEINVPLKLGDIEYSNLVAREYFVTITLELPMSYEDVVLKIPVQIGDEVPGLEPKPPTYWEVLEEDGIDYELGERLSLTDSVNDESETEL